MTRLRQYAHGIFVCLHGARLTIQPRRSHTFNSEMSVSTLPDWARPPINREMKILDRHLFQKTVPTSAATILDSKNIQLVKAKIGATKDDIGIRTVASLRPDESNAGRKCLVLHPAVNHDDRSTWSDKLLGLVDAGVVSVRPYELNLDYDAWSASDILSAVIPQVDDDDPNNPSGFAIVGHVAHFNLRERFLPYKNLIAQVVLDKNRTIRTVINKLHDVGTESVYRTFPYELLAGDDDLNVIATHDNCIFKFNFAEVYWNTRLGTEHERLVAKFETGQTVCDVMAGVGPFAVPAGKRKVFVWANDLNPACYDSLVTAIKDNKVSQFVNAFCMDGAEFIRRSSAQLLRHQAVVRDVPKVKIPRDASDEEKRRIKEIVQTKTKVLHEPQTFDHFVMNLPATAIEFVPAFKGIYAGYEHLFKPEGFRPLPLIHVYTFQAKRESEAEEKQELRERLTKYLGCELAESDELELHQARLVAPKKWYYCVSFRLPAQVAFAPSHRSEIDVEPLDDNRG